MTGMTGMTSDFYPFEMDFIGRVATAGTTGVSDFPHKLIGEPLCFQSCGNEIDEQLRPPRLSA